MNQLEKQTQMKETTNKQRNVESKQMERTFILGKNRVKVQPLIKKYPLWNRKITEITVRAFQ